MSHSKIGASSASRWLACPGSVALIEKLPPQKSTIYSAEGTLAHSLAEKALTTGIDLVDEIDQDYEVDGFNFIVTEEMVEHINVYVSKIRELVDGMMFGILKLEQRISLPHISDDAFGTADAIIYEIGGDLVVADFKYGRGYAVEVFKNEQGLYYALGAYYSLPEDVRVKFNRIRIIIIQPRADHMDGPVREYTISIEELLAFEKELAAGIQRVKRGDGNRVAGKHCTFCPAKGMCGEYVAQFRGTAGADFADLAEAPVKLPDPKTITPKQLAQILNNADMIKMWAASAWDIGLEMAKRGQVPDGYKVVSTKKRRVFDDPDLVADRYESEFGEEIYTKKLKSPAQMEKLLKTKRKSELEPYIVTPEGDPKLVRLADLRPGTTTGAKADFADL